MSDEKIDHAAKAEELLAKNPGDPAIGPEWGAVLAQTATAHATLALVEQQRIANLIALAQFGGEVSGEAMVGLTENVPHPVDDTWMVPALRAEIRKGLGL